MFMRKLLKFTRSTQAVQRAGLHRYARSLPKACKHQSDAHTFFTGISLMGMWGFASTNKENESKGYTMESLIQMADALFEQGKYKAVYDLLTKNISNEDNENPEVLWRISRALYNMSKSVITGDAMNMIQSAYDLINVAYTLDKDNWAVNKWSAILLDSKASFEGMRARVKELYNVKKYMMRAVELNPKDATTFYMLGNWCYQISDLPWYQKKVAAVVFGEPPTSSFEEALTFFQKAEEVDNGFYSHNLLMLGKTYLKLNDKEKAVLYLKKAANYKAKNDEDVKTIKDAEELLNNIK